MARPGTDPTCFRPEITSKEVGLLVAVLQRAIDDLGDPDDVVAFEAHEFFLQPRGPWAQSRRDLLDALGLDEEAVLTRLRPRFRNPAPERPFKRDEASGSSWLAILDAMPHDDVTTSMQLARHLKLSSCVVNARLHHLKDKGLVRRVRRGEWCRAGVDLLGPPPAPKPKKPPAPPSAEKRLLDALHADALTVRELVFALDGDVGQDRILNLLRSLEARRMIERDDTRWRLKVPQSSVAA
ncbi:helix-turn-helix domain-containing protein [Roseinatronobacter sp. S2]|uniref:MarR family transcriptional regulator n=1 Tax=Roseinatronobacter sp. S2 TaxID=3035471 RepID=UPI00240F4A1D|nr:helix-turn-helix domain-containing protein [Roseinatronobacter sp. S2]WFE74253.1 helix-turn-helix domain-containing protein [Roseinatronobacter sp. S2]